MQRVSLAESLFAELCGVDSCIDLFCDSQSAICLTKDQMFHERTKHIDVKYHYVRDVISQGKLKVRNISTHDNPADTMTKPAPVAKSPFSYQKFSPKNFYLLFEHMHVALNIVKK